MKAATMERDAVVGKRSFVPWLFLAFFCFLFFWLWQNNKGFALGLLVTASIVIAAIETCYAGMYWCTAGFAAVAVVFNPYTHVLPALDAPIAALAMGALIPMLVLFICRKARPYVYSLPDGSRWWVSWAHSVIDFVE